MQLRGSSFADIAGEVFICSSAMCNEFALASLGCLIGCHKFSLREKGGVRANADGESTPGCCLYPYCWYVRSAMAQEMKEAGEFFVTKRGFYAPA
ncbi:hypothetical protein KCP76_09620 [Salmonella enterica subsp. enterica serovar Weltevreden]|nr:hypothetical protein KCP76_09620 [Salmonella enterica subsp. enterica serovar Weltevreden]